MGNLRAGLRIDEGRRAVRSEAGRAQRSFLPMRRVLLRRRDYARRCLVRQAPAPVRSRTGSPGRRPGRSRAPRPRRPAQGQRQTRGRRASSRFGSLPAAPRPRRRGGASFLPKLLVVRAVRRRGYVETDTILKAWVGLLMNAVTWARVASRAAPRE